MRDRAYLSGYALIILLAGLGLQHMWQRHMDLILLETDDRIGDTLNRVNGLLGESASHVNMLRLSAENTLRDLATRHQGTPGYYHHLQDARGAAADPAGFCTADDMSVTVHPIIPAVSGLGPLPAAESAAGQEVAMALLLGPQFVATKQNIPNMAWVYYISARHFIALYPFTACKKFRFSDALYEREFFSLGRPEANPGRAQFWTSAHISEAGNGLTATVGAPVYDMDGKFRGTIDINLTLKTLSEYLQSSRLTKGTLLIVNNQEQVLAHPALLDAELSAAPSIKDLLPGYDSSVHGLIFGTTHGFTPSGSRLFAARALQGAPWRLIYVTDLGALRWHAWRESGVEIAGLLLLAGLIVALETARRSSRQLKANNLDLASAHAEAQKARREADLASRAKSLMMANVSHDLRTPLNAIIGFSDVMTHQLFGPLGAPRYLSYADDIKSSGEMLLKIIDNLLDLSKAESGEYKLNEEIAEIPALIENCRHLVAALAAEGDIALTVQLAPGLPALKMDQRVIQRVILNVLSNAIKFTTPGGRVTLTAAIDPEDRVTIAVADTGIGIAQRDLEQLFRPFSRGATAMKANSEGTGLGLSIVKSLMALHGGTVGMASTVGAGTVVTLQFPAVRNWRASDPLPEPPKMELPSSKPTAKIVRPRDAA